MQNVEKLLAIAREVASKPCECVVKGSRRCLVCRAQDVLAGFRGITLDSDRADQIWQCPECSAVNVSAGPKCGRCGHARPQGGTAG